MARPGAIDGTHTSVDVVVLASPKVLGLAPLVAPLPLRRLDPVSPRPREGVVVEVHSGVRVRVGWAR